jgi:sterol desaturase/sphingolipid hydroxylase (fatty acid hydroxylase superfamily)
LVEESAEAISEARVTLPTILTIIVTAVFLLLERVFPGRALPHSRGWYARSIAINFSQLAITLATGRLWLQVIGGSTLFESSGWHPLAQGFMGWFVGTFVFYWWHRLRHRAGFWRVFHQIHHSPSRIEILTSFYKHPVEILSNSTISAILLFPILGCSLAGSFWYNFFAATGEYFYHANLKTPGWLRFLVQTPELHSIHHQYDVHSFNFSDLPIWDRAFGTYRDTRTFSARCGFPDGAEQELGRMLLFEDVYRHDRTRPDAQAVALETTP